MKKHIFILEIVLYFVISLQFVFVIFFLIVWIRDSAVSFFEISINKFSLKFFFHPKRIILLFQYNKLKCNY